MIETHLNGFKTGVIYKDLINRILYITPVLSPFEWVFNIEMGLKQE